MNYACMVEIPFSKPYRAKSELDYIEKAIEFGNTAGGGAQSSWCAKWLRDLLNVKEVLLTNSATDALEMAALLLNIQPGDEVIMPSYTFSSTANAFVLRGAVPVFADVEMDTMNIDPELIRDAITSRTKALIVVHYAGASTDMRKIMEICKEFNLFLIEDAAQALMAKFEDRYLGSFGDISCFSFHSTKNIVSGEGGAIAISNSSLMERANILLEKGTNRKQYINGEVDKYSWIDIGSSYLPSEITSAYLRSQLEKAFEITEYRIQNWNYYRAFFLPLLEKFSLRIMEPQAFTTHNAHIFYLILPSESIKDKFVSEMALRNITCASHYVPLHNSLAGQQFGMVKSGMKITETFSKRLVRLPMWSFGDMPIVEITNACSDVLAEITLENGF